MDKEAMVKVPHSEREVIFRVLCGSDKWAPGNKNTSKVAPESMMMLDDEEPDDEEQEESEIDTTLAVVDTSSSCVFFWMELHPRVPILYCRALRKSIRSS